MEKNRAQIQAQIDGIDRLLRPLETLMSHRPLSAECRAELRKEHKRLSDICAAYIKDYNAL